MSAGSTEKDNDSTACCCSASLGPSLLLLETFARYCQSTTFNLTSTQHTCVFNTHAHTHGIYCIVLLCLSSFLCSAQCDCLQVLHHKPARSCLLTLPSKRVAVESRWTNRDTALKAKPKINREQHWDFGGFFCSLLYSRQELSLAHVLLEIRTLDGTGTGGSFKIDFRLHQALGWGESAHVFYVLFGP